MERNGSIDAVKGICVLHMIYLHLSIIYGLIDFKGNGANLYFHQMEFFMIPFYLFSGFFFTKKLSFKDFINHKSKKLLIPLLFWSVISLPIFYLYQYLLIGDVDWISPFKMFKSIGSLSSNDALWFLFSLFFVNVIYYYVTDLLKEERLILGFIVLCFCYSCLDRYVLPCYFSSSNISMGLVYFYIGNKLKEYSVKKDIFNYKFLVTAILVYLLVSLFNPQWMQIVTLYQTEGLFTLNLLFALSGAYILWWVLSKLPTISILSYFGKNSMTYYVWHMIPLRLIWDPIIKNEYPNMPYYQYVIIGGA